MQHTALPTHAPHAPLARLCLTPADAGFHTILIQDEKVRSGQTRLCAAGPGTGSACRNWLASCNCVAGGAQCKVQGTWQQQHHCSSFFPTLQVHGLEFYKDGAWHSVTPAPGALTINVGDQAQVGPREALELQVARGRWFWRLGAGGSEQKCVGMFERKVEHPAKKSYYRAPNPLPPPDGVAPPPPPTNPRCVQVLTNDIFKAPLHRVRSPHNVARLSTPFFFNPRPDAVIEPLSQFVTPERPAAYRPIPWRSFREQRFAGAYQVRKGGSILARP